MKYVGMFITSGEAGGSWNVSDACGLCRYVYRCYLSLFGVSVNFLFALLAELVLVSEIVSCVGDCGMYCII